MHTYARIPVAGLLLLTLKACSPLPPPPQPFEPLAAADTIRPIVCEPLIGNASDSLVTSTGTISSTASRPLVLELPADGGAPMVRLTVPATAIPQGEQVTFTLEAPAATPYVYVRIAVTDSAGGPFAGPFAGNLELALRVEDRRCDIPDGGLHAYLYNIGALVPAPEIVITDELRTTVLRAGRAGDGWFATYRARGTMQDFSGFIVAQGRH